MGEYRDDDLGGGIDRGKPFIGCCWDVGVDSRVRSKRIKTSKINGGCDE